MLWLWVPSALAQSDLGQVLDAGGKLVTLEEFKQELVQHALIGPTPTGSSLEIIYTTSGGIQGTGVQPAGPGFAPARYNGNWVEGENGSVCSTLVFQAGSAGSTQITLPRRCQFWFKVGERYYLSDSDTDRSAKVLLRTIKR
jgi:hypothetical protein